MIERPRVKFCGMTRREDAIAAAELGADAVGLVFWPESPRRVTPEVAAEIVRDLPAWIDKVGVFVDERLDVVESVAARVGLTMVQLHGDERMDSVEFAGLSTIKTVSAPEGAEPWEHAAWEAGRWDDEVTLLVDARDPVRRGGTGQRANWRFAHAMSALRPVVLAGGLTPGNVIEAIHSVIPFALDVSSGVEASPGVKDARRMRDFLVAAAQGWGHLQRNNDEVWRARVQFRDAAPRGLGRTTAGRAAFPG